MPRPSQPEPVYRAKDSFVFPDPGGVPLVIQKGELKAGNDYAVRNRPDMFEPVTSVVEAATAEPGQVRSTPIPRKETTDAAPASP